MDPALWRLLGSDHLDEVEAIIRLAPGTQPPAGVRLVARFGDMATCRLKRDDILQARAASMVESLKATRLLEPEPSVEFEQSASFMGSFQDDRRPPGLEPTGRGVIIGVIDWGCDFAHPDFRHEDGRTRLMALWDQRGPAGPDSPQPYNYGRLHTAEAINRALETDNPYATLGYHPADGDPDGSGSHGTHVLSIAAGNGRGGGPPGIAPEADLIFVHLAAHQADWLANLGDSVTLLEAADFIARMAAGRPCVVNTSLGRHWGPHDGSTSVERGLDYLTTTPGCCIVQSCGNYFDRAIHTAGRLRPGECRRLYWCVDAADQTPNELEIWYPKHDAFIFEILPPRQERSSSDEPPVRLSLGQQAPLLLDGTVVGQAYHRQNDPNNGDHHINVFLDSSSPTGSWEIRLLGQEVTDGRYHGWVERDAGCPDCQSRFEFEDSEQRTTTGTICNGLKTIAVGAFNPHSTDRELASFSSSGPTRDGRIKPNLVAPGVQILAARSTPRDAPKQTPQYTRKSGTSMAAPHVTGAIALMLQVAGPLDIEILRRLLLSNLDQAPVISDRDYHRMGEGYLNVERVVAAAQRYGEENRLEIASVELEAAAKPDLVHPQEALGDGTTMDNQEVTLEQEIDVAPDLTKLSRALVDPSGEGSESRPIEGADHGLRDNAIESVIDESMDVAELSPAPSTQEGAQLDSSAGLGNRLVMLAHDSAHHVEPGGLPGDLLNEVLTRTGMENVFTVAGPENGRSVLPAMLFDALAPGGNPVLARHFRQFFEVVAGPGEALNRPVRAGDLLLQRALGEGKLAHTAIVAAEASVHQELERDGYAAEGKRGDHYVEVIEETPQSRQIQGSRYRRLTNEAQRLGRDQMVLRLHTDDVTLSEGNLTPNFDLSEFSSRGAPIPVQYLPNVRRLAQNLQVLRGALGQPVIVTSGYRTAAQNAGVGGAQESQHLTASAADILVRGLTPEQVYCTIENLIRRGRMAEGGLGIYSGHVHYDVRGQRARWPGSGLSIPSCPSTTTPSTGAPSRPGINATHAVERNRYWGGRLGWNAHLDAIVRLLHCEPYTPNEDQFAELVHGWQQRNGLQADGIIGPATWQRMQRVLGLQVAAVGSQFRSQIVILPPPADFTDAERTALAITSRFENGVSFGCRVSATDGISVCMLQWNLLAGTLQTMLDRFERQPGRSGRLHVFFETDTERLHRLIALRHSKDQMRQAVREARVERLAERWQDALLRLCRDSQFSQLLFADARQRMQAAQQAARRLGLRTVRGLTMLFDIQVGDGLGQAKQNAFAERIQRRTAEQQRPLAEQEKLREIAHEAADLVGERNRANRRARRLIIANGQGQIRNSHWNLDQDFPSLNSLWEGIGGAANTGLESLLEHPQSPRWETIDVDRAVSLNQHYARELGWQTYLDHIVHILGFSDRTPDQFTFAQAVSRWQQQHGLEADGIIGPRTWRRMQPLITTEPATNAPTIPPTTAPDRPSQTRRGPCYARASRQSAQLQCFPVAYPQGYADQPSSRSLRGNETRLIWFGQSFCNPRGESLHHAIDVMGAQGMPVRATSHQRVVRVRFNDVRSGPEAGGRGGNCITTIDQGGFIHYYAHLRDAPLVRLDDVCQPGQVIGYMGNTGSGGTVHLHYQIRAPRLGSGPLSIEINGVQYDIRGGAAVDPYDELVRLSQMTNPPARRRGPHSMQYEFPIPELATS